MPRSLRPLVLTTAVAVSVVAPASTSRGIALASMPDPPITITDPGDPSTMVDLTPAATVGTRTNDTMTTFVVATASGGGESIEVSETATVMFTTEVIAAAPDGGYTQNVAVASATSTTEPMSESITEVADYAALTGVLLTDVYDSAGRSGDTTPAPAVTLTEAQAEALASLNEDGAGDAFGLPEAPVGVGATWTITDTSADGTVHTVHNARLASVVDGTFTLEYDTTATYTSSPLPGEPSVLVSGTQASSGTQTGVVGQPVGNAWVKFEQVDDLVYVDGGVSYDYDVTWSTEWVSTPA